MSDAAAAASAAGERVSRFCGQRARQQLVRERAEGPHVGRGRDGLSQDLLGRGVGRSQKTQVGVRLGVGLSGVVGAEDLRDPEVEELDVAAGGHEDVRGLQVAVHDEAAVRGGHGVAGVEQQRAASRRPRALRDRQYAVIGSPSTSSITK